MDAPTSEEEVAARVRAAAESGQPLAVLGAGSKRHHGPAVAGEARPVTLRHLCRITEYEAGDMVVGVQAGVRLAELQRRLAARGQWLPIDPPYADATIGGILATASAGPRRLGYGAARDHLLGMRVVGADGVVTRSGGRVVKNVTGYDLHKLHVGAMGSLGVIVEAHFKVQPRPEVHGAALFPCPDFAAAHRLLLEIAIGAARPVALEALSAAAAAALGPVASGLPVGQSLAVVGLEGSKAGFERQLHELERHGRMTVLRSESLWTAFRDAAERRRDEVTVRVGARPADLPALIAELPHGTQWSAQAALGVARAVVRRAPDLPDLAALVRSWHERAAARGGYAVVESAPLELEGRAELPWGTGPALGRALKARWDPRGILNPGRMPL
jgi:glycolate oxidase FAD binding subunit